MTVICTVLTIALLLALGFLAVTKLKSLKRFADRVVMESSNRGVQAKFKLMVGFFQVVNTLDAVYGVRLHAGFDSWYVRFAPPIPFSSQSHFLFHV